MIQTKRIAGTVMLLAFVMYSRSSIAQDNLPQLGKSSVSDVVKAMTLEEKLSFVVGEGLNIPGMALPGMPAPTGPKRVPGASGTIKGITRLGIPSVVVTDGPTGVHMLTGNIGRIYYATAWPTGTLLSCSFDTALAETVGKAFGAEAKEYGVDVLLGPGMNIHRNPLGARNFEYYSEDPVVTGNMAAGMVRGIQSSGVGTSVKHFAANNQETNRNTVNTIMSERALREIYLRGWQIVVKKAEPWTVMSSYNKINGVHTSQSGDLLNNILRNEWGYKGFVMTDWFGGNDAVEQMKAGNNLLMPGKPDQNKMILDAVTSGKLDVKIIDKNVEDILNIILKTPVFNGYKYSDQPDLKKNARLSRMAAAESMVLLKNEGRTLPISADKRRVAVLGNNSFDLVAGGTGSGAVNTIYVVPLAEGIFKAGYIVDPTVYSAYSTYLEKEKASRPPKNMFEEFMSPSKPVPEMELDKTVLDNAAESDDIAVVSIGRNAGEGTDRKLTDDYYFSEKEKQFLRLVSDAFHAKGKKVVVVLNVGGVVDVTQWRDLADAILLAWQPGLEGGNAIADILTGKVNPSGKLATSFPASYNDVPSSKNFPGREFKDKPVPGMMGMPAFEAEVVYEEGIYVGYRYYNTFNVKPAYEFGYGLSYTTFGYTDLKLSSKEFAGSVTASVTVTNTGNVAGKEAVQLYISAPAKKMDKPAAELKLFGKTKLLQPGQSETLTFLITPAELASFDVKSSAWIAEAGDYTVKIGASSADIRRSADFKLPKELVVEKTTKSLVPQVPINELKPVVKK